MSLDFQTLYLIILLNSLCLIVVWAAFAYVYRDIVAARFWLAALVATSLGGLLLSTEGGAPVGPATLAGMVLIGMGFAAILQGVAVFYAQRPRWHWLAAYGVFSLVMVLAVSGVMRAGQNVVFAALQALPTLALLLLLTRRRPWRLGTSVAAAAAGITLGGQATEIVANVLRLSGALSDAAYAGFGAWLLVATVIGTSALNLGFLLMAIDRLSSALADLARRDELTGLPNRRGLRAEATALETRARREGAGVAIMMLDVDDFKQINDTFGHQAGDASLAHIATVLRNGLKPGNVVARVSGDEFCVLMPRTALETAEALAGRLVAAVAGTPFIAGNQRIPLSISIGLAQWAATGAESLVDAVGRADGALYEAKRAGRNGFAVDAPETPQADNRLQRATA